MKAATMVRVAIVDATGDTYLVQQVSVGRRPGDPDRVHVWGDVVQRRGLATKHESGMTFDLDAVVLVEVEKNEALVESLWEQTKAHRFCPCPPCYRCIGSTMKEESGTKRNERNTP